MQFHIINGPNLNLLGVRRPDIYGLITFEAFLEQLRLEFEDDDIWYFQTNHEGSIIDKLHEVGFMSDGIILNAGGYTHTSIAIRDAVEAIQTAVVEVHISDIHSREAFRQHSMLTDVCLAQITGRGLEGYREALQLLKKTRD